MLVLCVMIVCAVIFPLVYKSVKQPDIYDFKQFEAETAAFKASAKPKNAYSYTQIQTEAEETEIAAEYFEFDPNGLPAKDWQRLGLTSRQVKVIKNYEAKGGKFYRKEDVQKIYSVTAADYARLEPYIHIKPGYPAGENTPYIQSANYKKPEPAYAKPVVVLVELNLADSVQLETVRGIGPAFASRIVRYKNRLGGFNKKEQLLEVFGMDSAKYAGLKDQVSVNQGHVQQININTAAFEDLKRHPYLTYKQMNAIIQYRKQHGDYSAITDLEKVILLDKAVLLKIAPYISFK